MNRKKFFFFFFFNSLSFFNLNIEISKEGQRSAVQYACIEDLVLSISYFTNKSLTKEVEAQKERKKVALFSNSFFFFDGSSNIDVMERIS